MPGEHMPARIRRDLFLLMKQLNTSQPGTNRLCVLLTLMMTWTGPAAAHPLTAMHTDPIAPVILGVTGILFFAILGRFAARKLGQPSV